MPDSFEKVWLNEIQRNLIGTKRKSAHVSVPKTTIKTSDPFMSVNHVSTEVSRKKHQAQKSRAFRRSMKNKKKHGRP